MTTPNSESGKEQAMSDSHLGLNSSGNAEKPNGSLPANDGGTRETCPFGLCDFTEEYYGWKCSKCGLFYAFGQAPWEWEDEEPFERGIVCSECGGSGLAWEGWDCEECDGYGYWDV